MLVQPALAVPRAFPQLKAGLHAFPFSVSCCKKVPHPFIQMLAQFSCLNVHVFPVLTPAPLSSAICLDYGSSQPLDMVTVPSTCNKANESLSGAGVGILAPPPTAPRRQQTKKQLRMTSDHAVS